ncbi:MAG: dockerin type I domain-containing protein, partial [Planctomycetota bacterium]
EVHLDACAACRQRAGEIESLLQELGEAPQDRPVPARVDRAVGDWILGHVAERKAGPASPPPPSSSRFWRNGLAAAAAVVLLIAGFLAGTVADLGGAGGPDRSPEGVRNEERLRAEVKKREEAEREIERLSRRMTGFEEERDTMLRERKDFLSRLKEGASSLKEAVGEIGKLRGKIEALQNAVEGERQRGKQLQGERDELGRRLSVLEEERKGAGKRISECLSRIGRLEEENRSLSGAVESAQAEVALVKARNMDLEKRLLRPGDWNRDGSADIRDSSEICRRLAAGENIAFIAEADLNLDGKIDVADALLIARASLENR